VNVSDVETTSDGDLRTTADGRVGGVTVIVSEEVKDRHDIRSVAETFATVTYHINHSQRRQETTLHIVPPSGMSGAGYASGNEVYIRGEQEFVWDGLMAHEYVHTRQDFSVAPDMEWIIEASGFYHMALVPYNCGTMSWSNFKSRIEPADSDAILTQNTSYEAAATRGTAVLAALDRQIRDQTNGNKTLAAVFRQMNSKGRISYMRFKEIVADVVGQSLDPWLDAHVDGRDAIAPPERGQFDPTDGGDTTPDVAATTRDNRSVEEGATVELNGSASTSAVSYSWAQIRGPTVDIRDRQSATPEFTAPSVSEETTLRFELEVTDENGNTAVDTVTITITASSSTTLVERFDIDGDDQIGNLDVLQAVNAATNNEEIGGDSVSNLDILQLVNRANS
jgi:hypothetical protein